MNLTKKHLMQIMDECRKQYIELRSPAYLYGDTGVNKTLTDGERLALCYLRGCLLTLNANKLLCAGWENELLIEVESESSK